MKRFALLTVGSITLFDHMLPVPALPGAGETYLLDRRAGVVHFGGCGLNQAMAAAALQFPVATAMAAGADFHASGYRQALVDAGVDVSGVEVLEEEQSGHSYLVFDPAGDSFLIVEVGAARLQDGIDPPEQVIRDARAVLLNMPFDSYCERAARIARDAGALVVASGQLMTAERDVQRRILSSCTHFACNEAELEALLVQHETDDVRTLFGAGFGGGWVTAGAAGVKVLWPDGSREHVPPSPVEQLVDPIGAGDAFVASATSALTAGLDLVEAARVGSVAASFVVEVQGCQTNLPDRRRLAERYRSVYGGELPLPAPAPA